MMSEKPTLVAVLEIGSTRELIQGCEQAGYEMISCTSMRKGLAAIKKHQPAVVVADFIFNSNFPNRISSFETLIAGLQRDCPQARLVAMLFPEDQPHLDSLANQYPLHASLEHPFTTEQVIAALCLEENTQSQPA